MLRPMIRALGLMALTLTAACESKGGIEPTPPQQRVPLAVATEDVKVLSTLSDTRQYSQSGYFAYPVKARPTGGTLIVALHGASYNANYFNAKAQGDTRYSFIDAMVNGDIYVSKSEAAKADPSLFGASLPVLALDDFGAGKSSKPGGLDAMKDFLSIEESAAALHQVLVSLKTDQNPLKIAFSTLVVVCHSKGCAVAIKALSDNRNDADALVITGFGVSPHALPPALADPRVQQELGLQPWPKYPDDLRRGLFYSLPDADPAVIAYDNTLMSDTVGRLQLIQLGGYFQDSRALGPEKVTAPILQILSDKDALYPSLIGPTDKTRFSGAKSYDNITLQDAGHSIFLHKDGYLVMNAVNAWIARSLPKQ